MILLRTKKRHKLATASRRHRTIGLVLSAVLAGSLTGCAEQVIKRGYHLNASDIQQIQPGMGKEQVRAKLGTPTTSSTVQSGSAFYYISSTHTQSAFFKPAEQNRQVIAVYFNETGTVDRMANYGLKDGKVFDYISRTTPAPGGQEDGLIKQLFRNLGQNTSIFGDGS